MTDHIVFVHGMFQNPKSWDNWMHIFEAKGYHCTAPAWPLHDGEPADLRQNPPIGLGELSLDEVVTRIEAVVAALPQRPIVIGHSVGGLIVQILANKNLLAAGVCIDSIAPNAMLAMNLGFFKNSAKIANPLKGDQPIMMDEKSFHASFANTMSETASDAAFRQYATHDSRNVLRDCMGDAGKIDLHTPHKPLLFISGQKDEIVPPSLNQKNAKAYTDKASVTNYREFPGRGHFICGQPGWEAIAEYVHGWLRMNAG